MIGLAEFQISTLLSAASARQGLSNRFQNSRSNGRMPLNPSVGDLFREVPHLARKGGGDGMVTCLITDSRRVVPGALFFAIGGLRTDGNFYIEEAVDRGAVAIVTEQDLRPAFSDRYDPSGRCA